VTSAIPKHVRTRINRLAHQSGLRHAGTVRDRLTAELQALAKGGGSLRDLLAHLEAAERVR
jgi:hypothetical protein